MNPETLALHAGYEKDTQGTMAVPIYQSTAYEFGSAERAADLFALREFGNIYSRLSNPTTDVLEKRFAEVEGGAAALATGSGMAAIFYAVANLAAAGENILVSSRLYGGTLTLVTHTLKRFGIEARVFDAKNPQAMEGLIDQNTRAILFESISNPSIDLPDIEGIVNIGSSYKIVTVCDNTVATPFLFRPFEWGIDVSVHSLSKYVTGQGLAIGGILVERAGLNDLLRGNERYAHFNEPDESYHGLIYADLPLPAFCVRARLSLARDIGAVPQPFASWLFIQGLETLSLRITRHSENALKVAQFLKNHPKVKSVKYPGLEGDENHDRAKRYLRGGFGGLLSVDMGDFDVAKKMMNNTRIFSRVANIGDSKSIITHSASTTHQQLSKAELKACGVGEGLVRLSIGLEAPEDLIADLEAAMKA